MADKVQEETPVDHEAHLEKHYPRMHRSGDLEHAAQDIEEICNKVKSDVENRAKREFSEFFPYAYRTEQRMGGASYAVKVYVGKGEAVFLWIGCSLSRYGTAFHMKDFEAGKKPYDDIELFP